MAPAVGKGQPTVPLTSPVPRSTRSPPASVDATTVGGSVGRYSGGVVALPNAVDGNAEPTRLRLHPVGSPDGPASASPLGAGDATSRVAPGLRLSTDTVSDDLVDPFVSDVVLTAPTPAQYVS